MSAWIVTKAHIDVLVHALGVREMLPGDPDSTGALLWQECHDSVNFRYNESEPCPTYTFTQPPVTWTPSELKHHVDCYQYQSCEHEAWTSSPAAALMRDLTRALTAEGATKLDMNTDVPWGVHACGGRHRGNVDCDACEAVYAAAEAAA